MRDARPGGALLELRDGEIELGAHGDGAERDDPAARLELREEEDLVDQLAHRFDLVSGAVDEGVHVLSRQRCHLEQRQQPRQRRPQLVRDGRREPGPQLLVGRHVADLAQVDDSLPAPADLEGDDQGHDPEPTRQEAFRDRLALVDPVDRLPRAPAGEHHRVGVVEDDHGLAALLDEHSASSSVGIHLHMVLTEHLRADCNGHTSSTTAGHWMRDVSSRKETT